MKNLHTRTLLLFCIVNVSWIFSACGPLDIRNGNVATNETLKRSVKKKGIIAIVYADLTGSINEETANRVKKNIGELFRNSPPETKFYLYSIDKGTSKPDIFNFVPTFTEIKTASDEDVLKDQIAQKKEAKNSTELQRLNDALDGYQSFISKQKGPVSCIANKLNSLLDVARNKSDSYPDYALRIYFYSDMIEECSNSFDGKPLNFVKKESVAEEEKHLSEITDRVENGFANPTRSRDLKSLGVKIHIILTSQDDKENFGKLKTIWANIFTKFGYSPDDINSKDYFYWGDGTDEILWKL